MPLHDGGGGGRLSRRSVVAAGAATAMALAGGAGVRARQPASPVAGPSTDELLTIVREVMDACDLRAAILHVAVDGEDLLTEALGESMTGTPATTDMRFRNGAVAISLAAAMVAVGEGALLSPKSSAAQLDPELRGFGAVLDGCATCHTLDDRYNYGLGVVLRGPWIIQNPLFSVYSGVSAHLPSHRLVIAVADTYGKGSFDDAGEYAYGNASDRIFRAIADRFVPDGATPAAG